MCGVGDIMYTTDPIALAHKQDVLMQHCQLHPMLSSITRQQQGPANEKMHSGSVRGGWQEGRGVARGEGALTANFTTRLAGG